MKKGNLLIGLAAGMAAGALLGVAITTEMGKEIRKKIMKKGSETIDELQVKFDHFVKDFSKKFENARTSLKKGIDSGKEKAEENKINLGSISKDPITNSSAVKKNQSETP